MVADGDFAGLLDVVSWQTMVAPGIVATLVCAAIIERELKNARRKNLQSDMQRDA
jgi:hypothetical protein